MPVHRAALSGTQVEEGFRAMVGALVQDKETGFNLWAGSKDPVMLVWSPRIYEFLQVLESTLSYPPARGVCREVGYRSGFDGAKEIEKGDGGGTPWKVLLAMASVLAGAGWGVSEIVYDEGLRSVTWEFPKGSAVGVAARRVGRRSTPACAFFEGFGAGWVKGSVGIDVEMIETECVGQGGHACRFESRPLG